MNMAPPDALRLLASIATALATLAAAAAAGRSIFGSVGRHHLTSSFERARRGRLAEGSPTYRTFESLIERLAAWDARRILPSAHDRLEGDLAAADVPLPWTPSEYRAVKGVEGALLGLVVGAVVALLFGNLLVGVAAGAALGIATFQIGMADLASRSARREASIRKALPFMVDLMALMMEAGASFPEALTVAAREYQDTPAGDEWARVLADVDRGRPRRDALESLRARVRSDDVAEIVFAVNKGEELGTPLSQILKAQAAQLRIKRSQWIEKASAEAEVKIAAPGFIVMIACMLVIAVPFLLQGAFQFLGD